MLCAYSKDVRCLKETQGDRKVTMAPDNGDHPAIFPGTQHCTLKGQGDQTHRKYAIPHNGEFRTQKGRVQVAISSQESKTDLHHGLLVLTVFHLCCGQVNDATLHWVFVTVIDEDIRATDHDKMFRPGAVKWLLEMQVSFLRDHGAKKDSMRDVSFSQKEVIMA